MKNTSSIYTNKTIFLEGSIGLILSFFSVYSINISIDIVILPNLLQRPFFSGIFCYKNLSLINHSAIDITPYYFRKIFSFLFQCLVKSEKMIFLFFP